MNDFSDDTHVSMIDFLFLFYTVCYMKPQMDMDMAVVTTVATVVGAAAHVVKVRILASFLYFIIVVIYEMYTLCYILVAIHSDLFARGAFSLY